MSLIILKNKTNSICWKLRLQVCVSNSTLQQPLHAAVRKARASCHSPVPLEGTQKPAGGSPVMKDAGTWDFCTIKFVRTESHCASLSLSTEGRLSPLSLLKYSGIYEYRGSWAVCECQSFLFSAIKKKKVMCCYFSTSSVFPHAENILELLLQCTISLTLVSSIHQNNRAGAESKNNIDFTKSRKLTLGVKIVHKIDIFSVDGCTWTV